MSNTDFVNGIRYNENINIHSQYFSSNTVLRIRCDASGDYDFIYLDDVNLNICSSSLIQNNNRIDNSIDWVNDVQTEKENTKGIKSLTIYPNPSKGFTKVLFYSNYNLEAAIQLSDSYGNPLKQERIQAQQGLNTVQLNLSQLPKGMYFVTIQMRGETTVKI